VAVVVMSRCVTRSARCQWLEGARKRCGRHSKRGKASAAAIAVLGPAEVGRTFKAQGSLCLSYIQSTAAETPALSRAGAARRRTT
jgi:hypothetical protein